MSELYSIAGVFCEDFPGIGPWGGQFIRGIEGDLEQEIGGQLIDCHGPSTIQGIMTDDTLEFVKRYEAGGPRESLGYKFELKDGVWHGEYKSQESDFSGKSICKTNLCIGDMTFKKFDCRTQEGYTQAVIDSMISSGVMETFPDPETGEEMIRPVR